MLIMVELTNMSTDEQREKWRNDWHKKVNKNPAKIRELTRIKSAKYFKLNKDKILARRKVFIFVRAKRLVKMPCYCGEIKVEAHHNDYSKPLEVIWFCRLHHREHERKLYTYANSMA